MKKDEHRRENAKRILKQGGYARGGATEAKKAVHKHEKHDHPGKPLTKLKSGGHVHGGKPKKRLDKIARQHDKSDDMGFAKGGATKHKGKTQINIIVGKDGAAAPAPQVVPRPVPVPVPAGGPAAGGAPGGMTPPPGAAAARPPMKCGGAVKMKKGGSYPLTHGAGGGLGRMEKAEHYKKGGTSKKKK